MVEMSKYPLTIKQFRTWLKSKNENEIVGITRTIDRCPMVNFFKSKACISQDRVVEVDYFTTEIEDGECYKNPLWVKRFISETDDLSENELTVKKALSILNWVEVQECT